MSTVDPARRERLASGWNACRAELTTYVCRLVVRPDVAEEVVQEAAVRMLESESVPQNTPELRAWLFRVASRIGIDHLRRHATWRETVLDETRGRAEGDQQFVAASRALRGSPEMKSIAREHLAVCFACTIRNLSPHESAAILLKEVYDFTTEEAAQMLGATFAQAKNWVQSARSKLEARYAGTCALVNQTGACHQCVELDGFFGADRGDPLAGSGRGIDARLAVLRELRATPLGPWHQRMMQLVDALLEES